MNSDPTQIAQHELLRLVGYACDGAINDSQRTRLNELLASGADMRAHYLRYISLHSALTTTAGNQAGSRLDELGCRLADTPAMYPGTNGRTARSLLRSPLLRAAMILVMVVPPAIFFSHWIASRSRFLPQPAPPTVAAAVTTDYGGDQRVAPAQAISQGNARICRIAPGTRWPHPNESFTIDSIMRPGGRLRFMEGDIELVYESGVELLLMGPAEFILQESGGKLVRGGLMASVPAAGHGFTVETPHGKVVDLGTEFGVMVDDFGVSEVSVFEGKVDAFPSSSGSPQSGKIRVTQGSALQWNSEMLKSLEADLRRLPVTLASITRPVGNGGNEIALASDFRDAPLDANTWNTLGDIHTSVAGLKFTGTSRPGAAPYLITKEQYDPTRGPVTIVCDVRFEHEGEGDGPSFSILTRSAAQRSDMDRPWSDLLATCVRCNFRSAADEFDGLLEISTKYERDRELTGLSWRGFCRPQPGVLYRLTVRDDGVNVSFTVTQVDKPTITKTVICRSLFRGYENHIALEGSKQGTVVVEKLDVYQDLATDRAADHFARFGFGTRHESLAANGHENPLSVLIPRDAHLVVEDDFEQATLDTNRWAVLGDVSVDGGKVWLGQGAAGSHIDTFHPRPYLLTKRQFGPSDGNRYVLGKIEFDDNFLQGYGGSFAILSRCADHYGDGPEWAVSALSTGIRCNLWPAAPQADHNLEIHEKPTAATLSFVRGSALAIDPLSRCYYFLLEDSGEQIEVTFQDASDPTVVGTVRHQPSPHAPRAGFIGFESTWGSRVLLDCVKIYIVQPAASAR